jgi:hypothetical protein
MIKSYQIIAIKTKRMLLMTDDFSTNCRLAVGKKRDVFTNLLYISL